MGCLQNLIISLHIENYIYKSLCLIFFMLLIIGTFQMSRQLFNKNIKAENIPDTNISNEFQFSNRIIKSYDLGFVLFLISEFMVFFSLFWAWFHFSLAPSPEIGAVWPPVGIEIIEWFGLSFFNTCVLISSSIFLNWVEFDLKVGNSITNIISGFIYTILAGILFIAAQYIEFSKLPFCISDAVYSNVFYSITGLHLTHVLLGLILLSICSLRIIFDKSTVR